ncbi:MAG: dihydrodipicolinate synthase family protein [Acidimicrobiales bacterium]
MTEPIFEGVGVALVTLFDEHGDIDTDATAEHAVCLVDLGVSAVVVAGSTGEASALDADERVALLEAVVAGVNGRVPVIAGTGAPSARQAGRLTAQAGEHGAAAALVLSPPGTDDPRRYYDAVAKAAPALPLLAYHFPSASPPGIPVAVLPDLPVVGCKDSSGDPERLLEELAGFDRPLFTGSSAVLALAGPLGCTGAILALANVEPEDCIAAFGGDADAQARLTLPHLTARRSFASGLKRLMAARFGTSAATRMG